MTMAKSIPRSRGLVVLRISLLLLSAGLMIRMAWLGDDALITLRTALNVSHGWGAGFNVTEAVQGYTHPLWFLLWLMIGNVTGEWILTILALGVFFSCTALGIVLWTAHRAAVIILASAALLFSNAFMDYTTSGLENPLSWTFLGLFLVLVIRSKGALRGRREDRGEPVLVGLLAAGAFLTRFDNVLLIAPILVVVMWRARRDISYVALALAGAVVPLATWFVWTWVTYSSLLPNTFLAKQNLDIAKAELWIQGIRYLWVSFDYDPVTPVVLVGGLVVLLAAGSPLYRAAAVGILLYLVYVIYVGGDAMVGRFLATPLYATVLLLVLLSSALAARRTVAPPGISLMLISSGLCVAVTLVLLSASGRIPSALTNPQAAQWANEDRGNVWDARGKFLELEKGLGQWLLTLGQPEQEPTFTSVANVNATAPLRDIRNAANAWPDRAESLLVSPRMPNSIGQLSPLPTEVGVTCGLLGALGVLTGPTVHWIDTCALTDRFMAEQQAQGQDFNWVVAHYVRDVPPGYVDAVRENEPSLVIDQDLSTDLAALWRRIRP